LLSHHHAIAFVPVGSFYAQTKRLPHRGLQHKTDQDLFLTQKQVEVLLAAVEKSGKERFNARWKRDHAAIFLGFSLGCRVGEVCLLERRHFLDMERADTARIPTLKQRQTVVFSCPTCHKRCRVRADRGGEQYQCAKCGGHGTVPTVPLETHGIPEKDLPFIEEQVIAYIKDYLERDMRPDQRWLFEGRKGYHVSKAHLERIFGTYVLAAGLSPLYSWHSLRHGRGVRVHSLFNDLAFTRDALRHKNIASTQVYARLDPERKAEYKKQLERGALSPLKGKPHGKIA
jgi:integrase